MVAKVAEPLSMKEKKLYDRVKRILSELMISGKIIEMEIITLCTQISLASIQDKCYNTNGNPLQSEPLRGFW
jgi:hypothetical protein